MPSISSKGKAMPASPIRKLVPFAEEAKKKGRKVYHLNIGQPDIPTPKVALDALKNISLNVIEYSHSAGNESYRKKMAAFYRKININVDHNQMLITTGGSEAILFALMTCLNPGDETITPEPLYANYNGFAMTAGVKIVPVTSHIKDDFALPPIKEIEAKIGPATKAILICNPNNPTGYLYSKEEILHLRDIIKRHDLFLISDEAYREFNSGRYDLIVTTGILTPDVEFFNMYSNGFLVFYPGRIISSDTLLKRHLIEITAHSKMGGKYSAHFNFFVNDSLVADFKAGEKVRKYSFYWEGSLKDIDSLLVNFDNDYVDEKGDINLYVKEIVIDGEYIIPYQFHSEFDIGALDGNNRMINNYNSNAEIARNIFINKGIEPRRVVAVTAGKTVFNRTLSSVTEFRNWRRKYTGTVTGINIISLGTHSRRTWITYKSILGNDEKTGIISVKEIPGSSAGNRRYIYVFKEFLDFLYYRIILIFY